MSSSTSIPCEQSVLGGLMLDNSTWNAVADRLTAEDFFRRGHQLIFAATTDLAGRNEPFDALSVAEQLERHDQLFDCGGLHYLVRLVRETASTMYITVYAERVAEFAKRRRIKTAAAALVAADDVDAALAELARVAA